MRDLPLDDADAPGPAPKAPGGPRRWLLLAVKILLSAAIVAWLLSDLELERMQEVVAAGSIGWLVFAFALKITALVLHEVRIWMALPSPRPPVTQVVPVCMGAGLLNLVLPARAGDVAVVAALNKRFGVPAAKATAVVGVTSVLEAVVFAGILVAVLIGIGTGAATGVQLDEVVLVVGIGSVVAFVGVVVIVVGGRVVQRWPAPQGALGFVYQTLVDTAGLLTSPGTIVANAAVAFVQVGMVVSAFAAALPAAGIVGTAAFSAAAQVLALSSLASFALPPSWGVGPAAAAKLVLAAQGVGAEQALLYAAAYWLVSQLPFVLVGLPALWSVRAAD